MIEKAHRARKLTFPCSFWIRKLASLKLCFKRKLCSKMEKNGELTEAQIGWKLASMFMHAKWQQRSLKKCLFFGVWRHRKLLPAFNLPPSLTTHSMRCGKRPPLDILLLCDYEIISFQKLECLPQAKNKFTFCLASVVGKKCLPPPPHLQHPVPWWKSLQLFLFPFLEWLNPC